MRFAYHFLGSLLLGFTAFLSASNGQTAKLESVALSSEKTLTWCPVNIRPDAECSKQQAKIRVVSTTKIPEGQEVGYIYVVSGGEIEGHGANVLWNLSKAGAGKFSITVGLGTRGIIKGRTITKTILVEQCPICDLPCECWVIEMQVPEGTVQAGDAFIVRAQVLGGEYKPPVSMKWTGSSGTIVDGQGTPQVLVRTDAKMKAETVVVTLTIDAVGACPGCQRIATVQVPILPAKP